MATNILDKDHVREFNDFYSYLADKIKNKEHGTADYAQPNSYKPYSRDVVEYYRSHGLYDNILEKDYANYVILLLAPPQSVSNKISEGDSKMLFQNTVAEIAADKNLAFNETSRIYYSHINNIDDSINGYSRGEILASFKDSTDDSISDADWKVKDGILQKDGSAAATASADAKEEEDLNREQRLREEKKREEVLAADREREERARAEREERTRAENERLRAEQERQEKARLEREREVNERPVRAEHAEPVAHSHASHTSETVPPAAERRNLDYPTVKRIIVYHLESFGINSTSEFRRIMDGKSTPLFIISILVGLALLTLIVIYRNTLAYGNNFFADALQTTGDAIGTSPILILFVIFFLLLMVIVFTIFSYARFYEKRKLFLKNTPILIKALDVDEKTFNDVIDEKFYGEKIKLKNKAFG